jgi:hypothetical protein
VILKKVNWEMNVGCQAQKIEMPLLQHLYLSQTLKTIRSAVCPLAENSKPGAAMFHSTVAMGPPWFLPEQQYFPV